MTQIQDIVTRLKSQSKQSIKAQQLSSIPHYDNAMYSNQVFEYLDDAVRTIVNVDSSVCLKMNYLPFKYLRKTKLNQFNSITQSIQYMVDNDFIHPFILFINNRFVRWSEIKVISKQEKYYLLITPVNKSTLEHYSLVSSVQIIKLPFNVTYWEGYTAAVSTDTIFAFDQDGFSTMINPYVSIDSRDENLYHNEWVTTQTVNAYPVPINKSYKLYPENIIIFRNKTPDLNSKVEFTSSILTINDGKNVNSDNINFKLFYNMDCNESNDNITKASLSYVQPQVKNRNNGVAYTDQLEILEQPFDLTMNRSLEYSENLSDAIKYALKYNTKFFDDIYITNSGIDVSTHTGAWVNSIKNGEGILTIPRRRKGADNNYVVMFVNGELYEHYHLHKYKANKFIVPVDGILDTDLVEFMFLKNINNTIYTTVFNESDAHRYLDGAIVDNMVIYSIRSYNGEYAFPDDGLQNFQIKHSIAKDSLGRIKVTYDNPSYYGESVTLTNKSRFAYMYVNIWEDQPGFRISLDNNFRFCPDYDRYMVFLNGRRLDSDQYRLVIPSRTTTPFHTYEIYMAKTLVKNDKLEIFYMPTFMKNIVMYPTIPIDGDIVINKAKISNNFNKNLYMIWVNGKKINSHNIVDISSTKIKIVSDEKSVKTVCITKYIPDNDYLTPFFTNNESTWDSIIGNLSEQEVLDLLSIVGVDISDTEADLYANTLPVTSIMWELIRDHYMNAPTIDIGDGFVYDYQDIDIAAIEGRTVDGTAILPAYDSNREDSIQIERDWP